MPTDSSLNGKPMLSLFVKLIIKFETFCFKGSFRGSISVSLVFLFKFVFVILLTCLLYFFRNICK